MVGQITGLKQPQGITTDKPGDLYDANTNGSTVLERAILHWRTQDDENRSR
jgi:hypothetical protein